MLRTREERMLDPGMLLQCRYRIIRQIGKGGMGAVYEAIDTRLDCTVALKETLLSDTSMRRAFEREAQLLARLRHPTLPKVSDHFVENDGQFLVMEYIPGEDIAGLMTRNGGKFPSKDVLAWGLRWGDQLLDALVYLHGQSPSIVHQDIKPQNLKLTARGDIILLDFGLARGATSVLAATLTARHISDFGGFTPNYAPLEQIRGTSPDLRSDLYALAATLYHVLTGERPPDALSRAAALLNNTADPLVLASDLNHQIPHNVALVLHKALSLNLDERYASASDMRESLRQARVRSQTRLQSSDPVGEYLPMTDATLHIPGNFLPPAALSDTSPSESKGTRPSLPDPLAVGTLSHTFLTGSAVLAIAFSPDGQFLASGCEDHSIQIWQIDAADTIHIMTEHLGDVSSVVFHPNGQFLASGSEDRTVRLWSLQDGRAVFTQDMWTSPAECIAFTPDGTILASGGWGGSIGLWHVDEHGSLQKLMTLSTSFVHSLAFSPDGQILAAGCYDGVIRMWQVSDGSLIHILKGYTNFVLSVAFSPDGEKLAASGGNTAILLWRLRDGRLINTLEGHTNFVRCVIFGPDGKTLASGSEDKTVRLWRVSDGRLLHIFPEHAGGITSVEYRPDGQMLASGSRDTKIRLWSV